MCEQHTPSPSIPKVHLPHLWKGWVSGVSTTGPHMFYCFTTPKIHGSSIWASKQKFSLPVAPLTSRRERWRVVFLPWDHSWFTVLPQQRGQHAAPCGTSVEVSNMAWSEEWKQCVPTNKINNLSFTLPL